MLSVSLFAADASANMGTIPLVNSVWRAVVVFLCCMRRKGAKKAKVSFDKFEEEFVGQAKSSLDESILEPDAQDIEVQNKIQALKRRLK